MISLLYTLISYALILYLAILFLLIVLPYPFQPLAMYLHFVNFPFGVDWSKGGERFGFRAGAVQSFMIPTRDGLKLGAWHIIPKRDVSSYLTENDDWQEAKENTFASLGQAELVFLYFHGNAGNRATYHRTSFYKMLTGLKTRSHVIAIDYRGFGNSSSAIPTEKALRIDAYSAFEWVLSQGVDSARIVLVGHSLGSGIATDLAYLLCQKHQTTRGHLFRGLILLSGYASIADAAIGYPVVPLLRPFHGHSWTEALMKFFIRDKLDSHRKLRSITCPILFLHGNQDADINCWQAKANFLEAVGGRVNKQFVDSQGFWKLRNQNEKPFSPRDCGDIVHKTLAGDEGEFWFSSPSATSSSRIWLVLLNWAGHNDLSGYQLVQDTIEGWLRKM